MTKPYLKDLEGMLRFRMGYNYKLQMILQRCLSDDYLDYLFDMLRMSSCIHRVWSFDLLEQVPVDVGTMLSCGRPHSYGHCSLKLRTSLQNKVQFTQILRNL